MTEWEWPLKIELPIQNRTHAGRVLGTELEAYRDDPDMLILALPRGGVPVAAEIATALNAPLDLMPVRKLGVPGKPELAMGAIAGKSARVLNSDVVSAYRISEYELADVEARERKEIARRERAYRGERPPPVLEGRTVVLVDDGLATGATMRAAIRAAKEVGARKVIVAVPVAPVETLRQLQRMADEVHCLAAPYPFYAIGGWYRHFEQVDDDEVQSILEAAWSRDLSATTRPTEVAPL